MGKVRQQERDSDEFYRGIIRGLKSEIRQLRKRLEQHEKQYERWEKTGNPKREKEFENPCPNCGKNELTLVHLGIRIISTCKLCNFRKVDKVEK